MLKIMIVLHTLNNKNSITAQVFNVIINIRYIRTISTKLTIFSKSLEKMCVNCISYTLFFTFFHRMYMRLSLGLTGKTLLTLLLVSVKYLSRWLLRAMVRLSGQTERYSFWQVFKVP